MKSNAKLSFFLQHSGLFDDFSPRTRRTLENLPVTWTSAETDGETVMNQKPQWREADLEGTLSDKDFKIKVTKGNKRYTYTIYYENKSYRVESLESLKSTVESLASGDMPKPKQKQNLYDMFQNKRVIIDTYVEKKILVGITDNGWKLTINKDNNRIYLRFLTFAPEDKHHTYIKNKLIEADNYRLDCVGIYLKSLMKKIDIDPTSFVMTHRVLKSVDYSGFIVTVR